MSGGHYRADFAGGAGHPDYAAAGQDGYSGGAGAVYTPGTAQVGYHAEAGTVRSSATRSRSAARRSGSVSGRSDPTGLRVSLGAALTAGGGLVVVLCSLGPFIRYDNVGGVQRLAGKEVPLSFSAWSGETFLAPLTWWPILASLALVALVALRLSGLSEDREFLGFRPGQLQVMLSLLSFLVLLGYAFSGKSLVFGSELHDAVTAKFGAGDISIGWGGHLMLLGSLTAAVGAFLDHLGIGPTVWPQSTGSSGYQPRPGQNLPGYGYQQPAGYPPHQPASYQQRSGHYGM
jgi:hypothetical protein